MTVGFDPLYDMILEERNPDADTTDWEAVRLGRHWLLMGETYTAAEFGERAGCGASNIKHVKDSLIGVGYKLVRTTEGKRGRNGYQARIGIANLDHVPTPEMVTHFLEARSTTKARREELRKARVRRAERKRAAEVERVEPEPELIPRNTHNGHHLPDPTLAPLLDEALVVYALARNDDGTLTVGLRNGDRRFLTTLTGALE